MGLFWPIPADGSSGDQRIRLSVVAGNRTLANASIRRRPRAPSVSVQHLRPDDDGLYGTYYGLSDTSPDRPAVVLMGGSEGGLHDNLDLEAALLASRGYPALALAYFGEDGLPDTLSQIPLEYFANALRWLAHQPGVDPERLIVQGTSRGSEAALLVGVHYPDLVHGVIALSAANQAICSYPGCSGPAWTMHGKPLPYARGFTEAREAIIPVEKINGPILMVCGGADAIWESCRMEQAIQTRLEQHHFRHEHQFLAYPEAGHAVGIPAPYANGDVLVSSTSPGALNRAARARVWPNLLAFLARA